MSLCKSECLYSNNSLQFFKRAVPFAIVMLNVLMLKLNVTSIFIFLYLEFVSLSREYLWRDEFSTVDLLVVSLLPRMYC